MTHDTRPRPRTTTLGGAFRVFAGRPSPWIIAALLIGAVAARLSLGDWQLTDALIAGLMVAVFPLAEWMIHVGVLHWRPRRIAGHTVDSLLARKHREHHAEPRRVDLVFIPWQTFLWLFPILILIAVLTFPRAGLGLTFLTVIGVLGLLYEWTHYLIHTDYQPRTRLYTAVRRNHRLHHFKNEHYWFTVTTSGTADRLLHTYPDPAATPNSRTATALHGTTR